MLPKTFMGRMKSALAVAEGVAQHPKRAGGVPEAAGGVRRRQALGEVGSQGFVLAMPRLLRLAKEAARLC